MAQVLPFKKPGKVPAEERAFEKDFYRKEGRSALSFGDTMKAKEVSTGEQVEIDPVRMNSANSIFKIIERNFKQKDAADQAAGLQALEKNMGVKITAEIPSEQPVDSMVDNDSEQDPSDQNHELKQFMRKLAEKIFQTLENTTKKLAAIRAESIGSKTIQLLDEKGDANFVVDSTEGKNLFNALQSSDLGLSDVKKNKYGFSLENKAVGLKIMFIYDRVLHQDGTPKSLEELKDEDTPDEDATQDDTVRIQNQKAANQSNMGQGGSLAA
ncbi:MAG: hypothetical protein HY565_04380 [Candidatus Kerfeldbacteria bacterium]|nr:hypothetical protein [Candidatus Kerfeldbacteria bacterium]